MKIGEIVKRGKGTKGRKGGREGKGGRGGKGFLGKIKGNLVKIDNFCGELGI